MSYVITAVTNYLNSGGAMGELLTALLQLNDLVGDSLVGAVQLVDWQTNDLTRYAVQLDQSTIYAIAPGEHTVAYAAADYDPSLLSGDYVGASGQVETEQS